MTRGRSGGRATPHGAARAWASTARRARAARSARVARTAARCGRALAVALALAACAEPEPPPAGPRVTIYAARRVVTLEPDRPEAGAVAVGAGRILGVGEPLALRDEWEGRAEVRVDTTFADKILLPGLIDPHLHPILAAVILPMEFITPHDWELPGRLVRGVRGRAAYLARLNELEASHPAGEPLFTWGYHPLFHGELARADLTAISAERPIVVWHRSFHEILVNDAALAWLGLHPAELAGHPHVDWARGHFRETGLLAVLEKLRPAILAPEWLGRGLAMAVEAIHRGGITTIGDLATGSFDLEAELAALALHLDRDTTPFRTLLVPDARALAAAEGSDAAGLARAEALQAWGSPRVHFLRHVKLFADGAFFSQLMQMRDGYQDRHEGVWIETPAELLARARPWWKAGYRLHVHVNGDFGVDATLDVLERLRAEHPREDHRYTLHHLGYHAPDQPARMAALGASVSANPWYLYALADRYAEVGLGAERAARIASLGSLARAGVPLSLHSDFAMAPAAPLRLAWVAVNRITVLGNVPAPEEKLPVEAALRAVTIEAARTLGMEEEIGSIAVGKRADFTVLRQDPTSVPPEALASVPIWGTVLEGRLFPIENRPAR